MGNVQEGAESCYRTADMDDATAYELTRIYWERKFVMAKTHPWWNGVLANMIGTLGAKPHRGALEYYQKEVFPVAAHLK